MTNAMKTAYQGPRKIPAIALIMCCHGSALVGPATKWNGDKATPKAIETIEKAVFLVLFPYIFRIP